MYVPKYCVELDSVNTHCQPCPRIWLSNSECSALKANLSSDLKFQAGEENHPKDDKGMVIPSNTDILDTWEVG